VHHRHGPSPSSFRPTSGGRLPRHVSHHQPNRSVTAAVRVGRSWPNDRDAHSLRQPKHTSGFAAGQSRQRPSRTVARRTRPVCDRSRRVGSARGLARSPTVTRLGRPRSDLSCCVRPISSWGPSVVQKNGDTSGSPFFLLLPWLERRDIKGRKCWCQRYQFVLCGAVPSPCTPFHKQKRARKK
jgi:hypothetical protein